MENTENLALPYIMPSQAQKHVTHNEALRMLDAVVQLAVLDTELGAPPSMPVPGARYIVGPGAVGAWSGHEHDVAAWQDGAWAFHKPSAGWLAWVLGEDRLLVFRGDGWMAVSAGASLAPKGAWSDAQTYLVGDLVEHLGHAFLSNANENLGNEPDAMTPGSTVEWTHFVAGAGGSHGSDGAFATIGINEAPADTVNRLRVASEASLFDHEDGVGHQIKINKQSSGDTCSLLFQTGYVGHAEFGLAGDNDWHVKVSADGSAWHEAIVVNRATGAVSMPNTPGGGGAGRELLSADRTYYVRTDGSDANSGLTDNSGGAFLTIQKAVDVVASAIDAGGFTVTIRIGDGTYSEPVVLRNVTGFGGAGTMIIRGNNAAPANVSIAVAGGSAVSATGLYTVWDILDLHVQNSGAGSCFDMRGASLRFGNVVFGGGFLAHVYLLGATVAVLSNYAVSGGATRHVICHNNSFFDSANRAVTYTGSPAFGSRNYECRYNSVCFLYGMTFSGGATGQRFFVGDGSVIHTNGGGGSYLPGNAAGSGTHFGSSPWGLYQ